MTGRIIRPGQKSPSPEQVNVALNRELVRVMNLHMRLINWCADNLPPDQMAAIKLAMETQLPPGKAAEIAELLGVKIVKPH